MSAHWQTAQRTEAMDHTKIFKNTNKQLDIRHPNPCSKHTAVV